MRGCLRSGVETRGVLPRRQEGWVFLRSYSLAGWIDQNHEQLQTQARPIHCFSAVTGHLGPLNLLHTCALAPPMPNEFTPTLSSRSLGHGVALTGTFNFPCSHETLKQSQFL